MSKYNLHIEFNDVDSNTPIFVIAALHIVATTVLALVLCRVPGTHLQLLPWGQTTINRMHAPERHDVGVSIILVSQSTPPLLAATFLEVVAFHSLALLWSTTQNTILAGRFIIAGPLLGVTLSARHYAVPGDFGLLG